MTNELILPSSRLYWMLQNVSASLAVKQQTWQPLAVLQMNILKKEMFVFKDVLPYQVCLILFVLLIYISQVLKKE